MQEEGKSVHEASVALEIFLAHRRALIDYAYRFTGDRAVAEDLAQEAWLRFDQASKRRPLEDPAGYLYRIARNLALDQRKSAARERQVIAAGDYGVAVEIAPDKTPTPETVALYKDEYAHLREAMAELPERTRIAVEMHRFGNFKLKEIAAFLGISVGLAHKLVFDGVEHCKQRMRRSTRS